MASVLEKLDVFRLSYPIIGLGFLASLVGIPYFFSKSEENQKKLMSTQSEEAQRRRAELWAKASPHSRVWTTLICNVKISHYVCIFQGFVLVFLNYRWRYCHYYVMNPRMLLIFKFLRRNKFPIVEYSLGRIEPPLIGQAINPIADLLIG